MSPFPTEPDLEPDVVLGTLEGFCSHVPEWIDDSVYLSPSAVLYLAVLAVVLAVVGERLYPSLGLTFNALKLAVLKRGEEQLGKSGAEQLAVQGMEVALSKLRQLPVLLRKSVEDKARERFPGMPEVLGGDDSEGVDAATSTGDSRTEKTEETKEDEPSASTEPQLSTTPAEADPVVKQTPELLAWLDKAQDMLDNVKSAEATKKSEWLELQTSARSLFLQMPKVVKTSSIFSMTGGKKKPPRKAASADSTLPTKTTSVDSTTATAELPATSLDAAASPCKPAPRLASLATTTALALSLPKRSISATSKQLIAAGASRAWCVWYGNLAEAERAELRASILELGNGMLKQTYETTDQEDGVTFLVVNFFLAFGIMCDYVFKQEWPTGGFMCQWAYIVSIVMYKPFSIPMWALLLACAHYSFSEMLYVDAARDKLTGTPYAAPFPRNRLTMALFGTVTLLQGVWCVMAFAVSILLLLAFAPVTFPMAFGLPFLSSFMAMKGAGWLGQQWERQFKAVALKLVARNGLVLWELPSHLRRDKEVAMAAVQQNGAALRAPFLDDKEVVMAAVKQDGDALVNASENLKDDKEVVMAAVKQGGFAGGGATGKALAGASERLKADKEVVTAAVKKNGTALEHASDELKGNKEIVTSAVNQNGKALKHASEALRADRNIVMAAVVHSDGTPYQFASEKLRGDKEIVIAAYVRCFDARYASEELKSDKKFNSELGPAVRSFNEGAQRKNEAVNESGANAQLTLAAKPIPFELTNLILKGAATQLVAGVVLSFKLLEFYRGQRYRDATNSFVGGAFDLFDLPDLRLQLELSFSWPEFPQPRLALQLGIGVFVLSLSIVLRVIKLVQRYAAGLLRFSRATPGVSERRMVRALAWCTWRPFGAAMDAYKVGIELKWTETFLKVPVRADKEGNVDKASELDPVDIMREEDDNDNIVWVYRHSRPARALLLLSGFGFGILPLLKVLEIGRFKLFTMYEGDDDVLAFTDEEESMAYEKINIWSNMRVSRKALVTISTRCLWLKQLHLMGCTEIKGDVAPIGLLANLRQLNCRNCTGLTGNIIAFRNMKLKWLNLERTKIGGDISSLKDMPLEELNLNSCKEIGGNIISLKDMPLKELTLNSCEEVAGTISSLEGMPMWKLALHYCPKIGGNISSLEDMPLKELNLFCTKIGGNISSLEGMPLEKLNLGACKEIQGILISLEGMPLKELAAFETNIRGDISSLEGIPLTELSINDTQIEGNIRSLEDMPLEKLNLSNTNIAGNITSLKDVQLKDLNMRSTKIAGTKEEAKGMFGEDCNIYM